MGEPIGSALEGGGVRSRRLGALVRYWSAKCGDSAFPPASTIDPLEIPRLLPNVLMAEMTLSGPRMRLLGSEATAAFGTEVKGRLVGEIDFGKFTRAWRQAFELMLSTGTPTSAGGVFPVAGQAHAVELVLLPLGGADGIDRIFGGLVFCPLPLDTMTTRWAPRNFAVRAGDDPGVASRRIDCYGR